MGIAEIIAGIIGPVSKILDDAFTNDEERAAAQLAFMQMQVQMGAKLLEYETARMEMQQKIITAEATSQSWLTRMWRPITMVTFLMMLVSYWLGYTPPNITEALVQDLFGLIKLGLGGYVIGRSAEKVVPKIAEVFKQQA